MATSAKLKWNFQGYLDKLDRKIADIDGAADRAIMAAAAVVHEGMDRRVAVLTGELQDHIDTDDPKVDGNVHSVEIGVLRKKGASAEIARKANAQEYGTSSMPAHPYARPTMIEDKAKINAAIRKSLESEKML
jgi:HK97 gp10 family phage protein